MCLIIHYPNPANSQIYIAIDLNTEQKQLKIIICNVNGEAVLYEDLEPLTAGKHTLNINLDLLPTGQYFFKISNSQRIVGADRFTVFK